MTRRTWTAAVVIAGLGGLVGLAGFALGYVERPDCPGKIVCPLTGKLVCKDRCPVNAVAAADTAAPDAKALPSCCKKGS